MQFEAKKRTKQMQLLPQDLISSLPDEILLTILSFLTVKDMLMTNTLSTRWLNLWVNTHVLDFQGPILERSTRDPDRNKFVEWVNRVIRKHKGSYLKKLRVAFDVDKDNRKDIEKWLEYALARKVEVLELNFLVSGCHGKETRFSYVFPDCFSSGKASLDGSVNRFLQADLKCLKSLSLKRVGVSSEAIHAILANFPFLERLEVVGSCRLVNLVISDPTPVLKHLQIQYCFELKDFCISKINIVSLDITYGCLSDLILRDLPMLVELNISGYPNNLRQILTQNTTVLPQLEALKLTVFQLEELQKLPDLAHLTKLMQLVIKVSASNDESLTSLFCLVESCPHLEVFVLEMFWIGPNRTSRTMREVERLSNKSKSLKVFEFKGYYGRVCDIEFVMHVIENAPGLERIIIDTHEVIAWPRDCSMINAQMEARSIALNQFEHLRESKCIPPNVDVLIRLVALE